MIARLAILLTSCCTLMAAVRSHAATLTVNQNADASKAQAHVYRNIEEALTQLRPGDTLLIANGTYRESIDLRRARLTGDSGKPTRISAASNAKPLLKGSDIVTGWERLDAHTFVKRNWNVNSQQVFVDGKSLQQIAGDIYGDFPTNPKHQFATLHRSQGGIWPGRKGMGIDDLTDNSFYYDIAKHALYVRSAEDLRNKLVEVSVRPYLIYGDHVNNVEIEGLELSHSNTTSVSQSGAITLIGNRLSLSDVRVHDADGAGIDISGDDNRISHVSADRCGNVGLKVRGQRAAILDSETNFNNTRGFNKWWEAGGAKFVGAGGLQNSEVARHTAIGNQGDGIWFDWHNDNNRVHHVLSAFNKGMGIHYEASARAYLYDNQVFGNLQRGIYLANSSHSIVAHNLVAANGMEGIAIVDDRNAIAKGPVELVPIGNHVIANVVAWNGKSALIVPANSTDQSAPNESDGNHFVGHELSFSLGWPSRLTPQRNGLAAWQEQTKFDPHSTSASTLIPKDVEDALNNRDVETTKRKLAEALLSGIQPVRPPYRTAATAEFLRPGSPPGPAL